jgi:hypothetical protein
MMFLRCGLEGPLQVNIIDNLRWRFPFGLLPLENGFWQV